LKGCGFILFNLEKNDIEFRPHDCRHLQCSQMKVAIARSGIANADVWGHSSLRDRWETNGDRWQQFTQVEENVYAIVY
jgi:hypothetical protein